MLVETFSNRQPYDLYWEPDPWTGRGTLVRGLGQTEIPGSAMTLKARGGARSPGEGSKLFKEQLQILENYKS